MARAPRTSSLSAAVRPRPRRRPGATSSATGACFRARSSSKAFSTRPTLYGAIVGGVPGVNKVVDIFRSELDLVMGQIGCPSLDQLGPDFLGREDWTQNR